MRSHLGSNYINGNPPTGSTNGRSTSAGDLSIYLVVSAASSLYSIDISDVLISFVVHKTAKPAVPDNTATRRPSRGGGGGGAAEDTSSLLKSLASMGSAAKKNLSQLAVRFSQQTSKRSEAGHPREFKHLVESGSFEVRCIEDCSPWCTISINSLHLHWQDEEDEGDATEVMFQHHKSRKGGRTHMLQEDDDDNFDSENPLIKGGATNNLSISSPLKKAQ